MCRRSVLQTPFVLREALRGYGGDTRLTGQVQAHWLATYYHGGRNLYTYVNDLSLMFCLLTQYDISDKAFITDANGAQFTAALADPEGSVRWIVPFPAHHLPVGDYGTVDIYARLPSSSTARDRAAACA